ncbi:MULTISPECIES: NtaA/DmoA family FMN-dependent monooxygenase [Bradyrhizobium]|uniref:N5,N10-methylene tetrahydromethanopterin reductase n=3 Tax=Bradyrhizobium TaxID=374 RepID=A0A410VJ17_9BRAD|nr:MULTISPECIES: NtaA/DmoA family FMN-dependent monooxygenase [Bradyrhizobium]MCG2629474.1 NtaA/DmoA family FMN-dependent monooxygenase [Bradyrhizobium zhengyangense]MCG2644898.1 NtaA/DmoA family FMN-dependent monooxygenase [Bradyrhizobium zhengyangense]MCG2670988.1 NtaA/DmoA family FMN-dependent monooxygenase [Bradyrhizobium zhengyangense]MDN4984623.1 NtaA/DmoA family FMN-dependent monooxygenase [Bradyrhizobium sp. WYCCWR 13022]MDN5002615.1 NtaA/DmoA family FMN-dependent monooxygenase [Bradyr
MRGGMHLIGFLINSPINHTILSWSDPADQRLEAMGSLKRWQRLAQTYERGLFDGLFFADTPGVFDRYKERSDEAVRYGVCWPPHDPVVLLSALAAATDRLGLAVTLSISANHPYQAVRSLSTLDYMSGGRVGWNIVTGHLRGEYRALGLNQLDHDQRYDRADEYMEVCRALWSGVREGAVQADRTTGVYADPAKVDIINHEGEYFRCHTVPPALPSRQGHPVLFQAGSSGRGQRFAQKHADVVFSIQPHLGGMKTFMQELGAASGSAAAPKVTFGVQPILGSSEAEARRRLDEFAARIPLEAALSRLSGSLGVDFSQVELDLPLEEQKTQASQGLMKAMSASFENRRFTLREAAVRWGLAVGMPQLIGTPEQVADQLETIWRETGCHGFNITPTTTPSSVEEFVDQVIPILQKRGVFRTAYEGETFRENLLN